MKIEPFDASRYLNVGLKQAVQHHCSGCPYGSYSWCCRTFDHLWPVHGRGDQQGDQVSSFSRLSKCYFHRGTVPPNRSFKKEKKTIRENLVPLLQVSSCLGLASNTENRPENRPYHADWTHGLPVNDFLPRPASPAFPSCALHSHGAASAAPSRPRRCPAAQRGRRPSNRSSFDTPCHSAQRQSDPPTRPGAAAAL